MDKKPKIALVTGGSRGLGKNMAVALAKKGMDIIITYRDNEAAAEEVVAEIHALGSSAKAFRLDTRRVKEFNDFASFLTAYLMEEHGTSRFDFLINNAGTGLYMPFAETTEEQLDNLIDIHYKGVFLLTQKLLPLIADGGAILNVSSGLTRITMPGSSAYGSLKSAVETLSRYLAVELGPRRIRVNVLAPGAIETDFGGGRVRDNPDVNARIAGITALGRTGVPDDIGGVVAFLCSGEAYWVNGQRIEVSGGQAL